MNKKQKIILGFFLIISFLMSATTFAVIPDSSKIDVTLTSQTPDPAEPGGTVELRFTVENSGGSAAEDVVFEVIPRYPFSLYSGSETQKLGTIESYRKGNNAIIVYYKMRIDANAVEGEQKIDIRYKIGSGDWIYIKDFIVRIMTADAILSIESVESDPAQISPGSEAVINFKFKNLADSLIKNIKVRLDLSQSSTPFAPVRSTIEKKIYQLASGQTDIMSFEVVALPEASAGIYKVPVNISYTDGIGTVYSKSDFISLVIGSRPDLLVYAESYSPQTSNLVIKITNRGLTDVKFLGIKLLESKDYEINSPQEIYVGNIDSDDYETAEFKLIPKKSGKMVFPVIIKYMDANNNPYEEQKNLELKVIPPSRLGSVVSGLFVTALVVALGLLVYWKFFKKKRRES